MPNHTGNKPRFPLGVVLITPEANEALGGFPNAFDLLLRHSAGDWGAVCAEDWEANENALTHGLRLLSVYTAPDGATVWVITEADRASTTILLPSEY
jgi:hypothetical protein